MKYFSVFCLLFCLLSACNFSPDDPEAPKFAAKNENAAMIFGDTLSLSYCPNTTLRLTVPAVAGDSVWWSDGSNAIERQCTSSVNLWAYKKTGGQIDTAYCEVTIPSAEINFPTSFSPNNDGVNDWWIISFPCDPSSVNVKIYLMEHQTGTPIWETNSGTTNFWQGYDNNQNQMPGGAYFYRVKAVYPDGLVIERTGWVQIVR